MMASEGLDAINPYPTLAIPEQREFSVPGPEYDSGTVQDATQEEPLHVDSDLLAPETHPSATISDDLSDLLEPQGPKLAQQGMQVLRELTNGTEQQNTVIEVVDETTTHDIVMKDVMPTVETTSTHKEPASTSIPNRLPNGINIDPLIDIDGKPNGTPEPEPVSTTSLAEPVAKEAENDIKSEEQQQRREPLPPSTPNTEKQRRHSSRQPRPVDHFSPVKPTPASPTPASALRRKDSSAGLLNGKSASPDASAAVVKRVKQSSPVSQRKNLGVKHVTAVAAASSPATVSKSKTPKETEEEASLRLAMEMQAQEFGLRRRSR